MMSLKDREHLVILRIIRANQPAYLETVFGLLREMGTSLTRLQVFEAVEKLSDRRHGLVTVSGGWGERFQFSATDAGARAAESGLLLFTPEPGSGPASPPKRGRPRKTATAEETETGPTEPQPTEQPEPARPRRKRSPNVLRKG